MAKKSIVFHFIVLVGLVSSTVAESADKCPFVPLRQVDFAREKDGFNRTFCSHPQSQDCQESLSNVTDLMNRMSKDTRVKNVAMAASIVSMVYVETGSSNFSPSTVERIGKLQRKKPYYPDFIGRGWVQLTGKEKYVLAGQKLGIDLVRNPKLALEPDNSYEIVIRSMTEGWLETYRSSAGGGAGTKPIFLSDFITDEKADYGRARAIINGDCMGKQGGPCKDTDYDGKGFLPETTRLDAGKLTEAKASAIEKLLCDALKQ